MADILTTIPPAKIEDLDALLADEHLVVMVVRGEAAGVQGFVDRAVERAQGQEWRRVAWVVDTSLFRPGQEEEIYEGHDDCCGAAWSHGASRDWVQAEARSGRIEKAFLKAEAS